MSIKVLLDHFLIPAAENLSFSPIFKHKSLNEILLVAFECSDLVNSTTYSDSQNHDKGSTWQHDYEEI
jgi:hypothetical protein